MVAGSSPLPENSYKVTHDGSDFYTVTPFTVFTNDGEIVGYAETEEAAQWLIGNGLFGVQIETDGKS